MANYSRLEGTSLTFDSLMKEFGVVTVMNAYVFENSTYASSFATQTASAIWDTLSTATASALCELKYLKVSNVTLEGPNKTITGGQSTSPLLKFGKKARLEMQDALGDVNAIDHLCGGVANYVSEGTAAKTLESLNIGEDFNSSKTIIGETYFVDKKGEQKNVGIIFYNFLPDSIFNLNQDAEGDAAVFDLNGDLIPTEITVGDTSGASCKHKFFYSIVNRS